ncbi:hypothetical protein GGX14DRAFT_619862 [Mycena pura]|uniref:Uncharacterized protein n=1 Tax=Mycena pura TaxID=153505 RepID=A0AAD6VJ31_9AGAR|nr:hypothetical protein GGX14DRAFT_619862 [Mycena pura]
MARAPRWQDPIGCQTMQTIVKKLIPTWINGLRPVQTLSHQSSTAKMSYDLLLSTWRHRELHTATLFKLVTELQSMINEGRETLRLARAATRSAADREKRKAAGTKRRRNVVSSEGSEGEAEDPYSSSELESDSSLPAALLTPPAAAARKPRKRVALGTITNVAKSKSRVPALTAADIAKDYGPAYVTSSRRRQVDEYLGEEVRRSSRLNG